MLRYIYKLEKNLSKIRCIILAISQRSNRKYQSYPWSARSDSTCKDLNAFVSTFPMTSAKRMVTSPTPSLGRAKSDATARKTGTFPTFKSNLGSYHTDRRGYCVISSSGVNMINPATIAWHIKIRSKGSLWRSGSLVRYNVASSSNVRLSMSCCFRLEGIYFCGGFGSDNLPSLYLIAISHVEATLR